VLVDFGLRTRYAGRIKWKGKQGRLEIKHVDGKWFALVLIEVRKSHQNPTRGVM
jgi:putative transposase